MPLILLLIQHTGCMGTKPIFSAKSDKKNTVDILLKAYPIVPVPGYHFHADPIWPDGTLKFLSYFYLLFCRESPLSFRKETRV